MFELLGISLALAAFLIIDAVASLITTVIWHAIEERVQHWSAAARSQLILTLRISPAIMAMTFVIAFLLPAYLIYEPRLTAEKVSFKLAVIAIISAAGLLFAAWRWLSAWRTTRSLINYWLQTAEPIRLDRVSIPAYRLRHSSPVIAVAGVFRPRLFIADHLFDLLSKNELAAALAHECGHLAARDNLKRLLLRACCHVLTIVPCGRTLDRAWAETSESAADEYAARPGGEAALEMASVLIKISRMVAETGKPMMPATVSHIADDVSAIARRAERLMQLAMCDGATQKQRVFPGNVLLRFCLGALSATIVLAALIPHSFLTIHGWIEAAVRFLQ
ncbi:MAG: M56 family metallopeptidase [Acidobacteria bacterium]|nr:M56 family metallopeptidase [Acidobacteriota bacterium]